MCITELFIHYLAGCNIISRVQISMKLSFEWYHKIRTVVHNSDTHELKTDYLAMVLQRTSIHYWSALNYPILYTYSHHINFHVLSFLRRNGKKELPSLFSKSFINQTDLNPGAINSFLTLVMLNLC